ncbi:unnamed protein product [Caenorhabditis sp. 36 PRJEB53466]|nr:unnamed protein product [Caenorhabditis sp. 36 PRJEB53466]
MLEFRYFAATIMLVMSSGVVILNSLVVRRMYREREGFHKICVNKAVANVLIASAFLIWAVPCSFLNAYYLPQRFNIFFGQIVGWGPYLMSGPFTQICLAVNRSVAISYPYFFNKQNRYPYTKILLGVLWAIAIALSLPAMIDGCSYIFFVDTVSWSPTDTDCSRTLSEYVTNLVLVMAIISFSINISSIVKIVKSSIGSNAVMDQSVSESRKKRRRKMFAQCIIQDCTHTFDCMVNTYVYTFYSAQWFQFLCGAVSALSVIMLDGLLMSVLHQKSNTPSQTREPPSKSHTFDQFRSRAPTEFVKFDLKGVLTTDTCSKICGELRLRRDKLVSQFKNASNDLTEVTTEFNDYLRLFAGFLIEIQSSAAELENKDAGKKNSKLIPLVRFKWGNSMLTQTATEVSDAWFEALSMIQCMAMWLTKHAASMAGKDEVKESDAKECLQCLRQAGGMFQYVKDESSRLSGANEVEGSDFDPKVMETYILTATAEAQEVIVARAIEMKHDDGLISSLSAVTASIFSKADKSLNDLPDEQFARWRRYLQLKHHFYLAYAYAFLGQKQLAEDKCGDAVRACKQGIAEYSVAKEMAAMYATATGPGTRIKPEQHLFFRRIEPLLNRHLEKAERENGFIYHQKVPDEIPQLDAEATYGVAKLDSFKYPPPAELWNTAVYHAFDLSKANMPDFSKVKKSKSKLDPVHEEKIYQTEKDPSNSSGCVIA